MCSRITPVPSSTLTTPHQRRIPPWFGSILSHQKSRALTLTIQVNFGSACSPGPGRAADLSRAEPERANDDWDACRQSSRMAQTVSAVLPFVVNPPAHPAVYVALRPGARPKQQTIDVCKRVMTAGGCGVAQMLLRVGVARAAAPPPTTTTQKLNSVRTERLLIGGVLPLTTGWSYRLRTARRL